MTTRSLSRLQKTEPSYSAACPGEASRRPKETDRHTESGAGFQRGVRAKAGARSARQNSRELQTTPGHPLFQCSLADKPPPAPGGLQRPFLTAPTALEFTGSRWEPRRGTVAGAGVTSKTSSWTCHMVEAGCQLGLQPGPRASLHCGDWAPR